jgi:modulator of FtsH protease HflK
MDTQQIQLPQIKPRTIILVLLFIVAIIFLYSCWFTVGAEEQGLVLRFGKFSRKVTSGLHLKIPFGIEKAHKVPVERQMKMEFGFRTISAGVRTRYAKDQYVQESLMLTGDLNAADVEWIVQYRVREPFNYLFRVRNVEKTFRDMNEAVMREVIGDRTINEVLTVGRQEIASMAQQKLQKLCVRYDTGIRVEQVVLQDVNPPDAVKTSFNEVNEAQQEREKLINEAKSEYNKVIPRARGEAERTIEEARGYALERVNRAKGEAARFTALFKAYTAAPEVTRRRMHLETLAKVMQTVERKIIADEKILSVVPLKTIHEK